MSAKISGIIFFVAAAVFAVTAMISGHKAYFGIAMMCLAVGIFFVFWSTGRRGKKRSSKKGRFEA